MRVLLILMLLMDPGRCIAQPLNYCDYFTLKFNESESGSSKSVYFNIDINRTRKTEFGRFLRSHDARFKYILLHCSGKLQEIKQLYPDTGLVTVKFCNEIVKSDSVQKYFNALTPKNLTAWDLKYETFSVKEMMDAASIFFYCDGINEADTTVNFKICIGINGRKEAKSNRDLSLLEAFSIEAILFCLSGSRTPGFLHDFKKILETQTVEKRKEFKDFNSCLQEIRQACFLKMQANTDLERKLLDYYGSNKTNLNFKIE